MVTTSDIVGWINEEYNMIEVYEYEENNEVKMTDGSGGHYTIIKVLDDDTLGVKSVKADMYDGSRKTECSANKEDLMETLGTYF